MIYPIALSLCSEDRALAGRLQRCFGLRRLGCYFYLSDRTRGALVFTKHLEVYSSAGCRIYLLRARSFQSKFPRFEIECGSALTQNLVVPLEQAVLRAVPNEYLFVRDPRWKWLPYRRQPDLTRIVDEAVAMLKP